MPASATPLLTLEAHAQLDAARRDGARQVQCSLDLMRTMTTVDVAQDHWGWNGATWPWPTTPIPTHHLLLGGHFLRAGAALQRCADQAGAHPVGRPTFEIDGIKMLPTAQVSPFEDAAAQGALIAAPRQGDLDTCGGLGYFAPGALRKVQHKCCPGKRIRT